MLYSFYRLDTRTHLPGITAMAEQETATKTEETPAEETPDPNLIGTLQDGTKLKQRIPRQRACNESGKNNNICRGHLKRWYEYGDDVRVRAAGGEVYRCERCQTLYLPSDQEVARTGTLSY